MGFLKRGGDFPTHPKGVFIFTIADVNEDNEGQYGPQLKWGLDSTEPDETGKPIRKPYWTGLSLSPKGKLRGLIEAAGFNSDDEYWDQITDVSGFDCLFGKEVQGQVTHSPGKEPGSIKDKLETIMAVPKAPARRDGPKPAAAPAEEKELVGAAAGPAAKPAWGDDD